ncbi:ErmE/ErmH/ErmO/ErmR family 23S rRNA (adenine(2058)-N(6))-methyltransferase [Nocardia sp. NPDC051030]|uniref:ErmE/ErmH/ErmO/ErmR family 23S rRNA (adenine(2058)-N(6))-methyltransferase n=1 Tax=Nocardia sp. NPDC051030 TaxID=3155162 RepID=UPI00341D2208
MAQKNFSSRKAGYQNHSHTQGKVGTGGGRTPRDRARRELSQNFLVDPYAIGLIVKAADPVGAVLEPGAGEGALTWALAKCGARVIAYEIDPLLAGRLTARTRENPGIRVVRGDFTKVKAPREPFAVVGNIPFSITARIVDWCLTAPALTSATLLTQLEYARKRSGDYGRWSLVTVSTWPWFSWELCGRIDRESFRPVPQVDSGILRIQRRTEPLVRDRKAFTELVELGFSGVGGTVRASLRTRYSGVDAALAAAGIAPDTVVAYVHPDQWIALYEALGMP